MLQNIAKKVDESYIVWFEKSNQWIQFEEPAWFVNVLFQKGVDKRTISQKFSRKFNVSPQASSPLIDEICACISALSKPASYSGDINSTYFPHTYCLKPYTIRNYIIGNKYFQITYASRLAEYYIHPPLAYLETSISGEPDNRFEIQSNANIPVLIEENKSSLAFEDFMRLRKRLYIHMVNAIFDKTNDDWMSFVHASALTNGKQTILFSSASGSGKSTMAALLQANGFTLVSDDFVAIDADYKHAFPFPAALSVKEGSFDLLSSYYGDLRDKKFNNYEFLHKSTRYLPPKTEKLPNLKTKPVKNIVFIRYNPNAQCNLNLMPQQEAFKLFHDQAWVSGDPQHAKGFINWFLKLRCYRLEYGNTSEAVKRVSALFEN